MEGTVMRLIKPIGIFVCAVVCAHAAQDEYEREYRVLETQIRVPPVTVKGADSEEVRRGQAFHPAAVIQSSDRDPLDSVLRRGDALLADLGQTSPAWDAIKQEAQTATDRKALYRKACAVRRGIAFSNPLLKAIPRLLFITREALLTDETQYGNHIIDQYFGFNATRGRTLSGNGLFVLENPFSDNPQVRDLLNGALSDRGGFLAPEISFDGQDILFCYTDGERPDRVWTEKSCFHIFRVKADGTGLQQITRGAVNDLFPCWLPSGRIMFVSERRGGFGRCHPVAKPSFTLFSMLPDGSDITRLSPHETNEWMPSVDHAGMVIYTRWDYVDRGALQAHHPWIVYPDGRDARAIGGNTHASIHNYPNAVMDMRAIPGSRLYSGLAIAHHSESRGSIIVYDPRIPDDDQMAQVKRVTPDQLFVEAEIGLGQRTAKYASPYPLSEKYYLCVYDGEASDQYGKPVDMAARNYAIVLLDVFGNREVLYRNPRISCLSPQPLMARPKPPLLPHGTLVGLPPDAQGNPQKQVPPDQLPKTALVGVRNVYNSRRPLPAGERITHLRIWQVLPKTEPLESRPRISAGHQKGAKACLGTVPVEADGSAYFRVPVNVPILFQSLTADGAALQGMRSVTYTAPGEQLMCNGCHDQRVGAPLPSGQPLAMKRAPSAITPGPDGTYPFSYPRLVQPIFDTTCVNCHTTARAANKKAPDLRAGEWQKDKNHFYTSFNALRPYVHFYDNYYWVESYTVPGQFGARASKLYRMLKAGHHDVTLSDDAWRRLIIWMDSNMLFFGHDAEILRQAAGEIVPIPMM